MKLADIDRRYGNAIENGLAIGFAAMLVWIVVDAGVSLLRVAGAP